MQSCEHSDPHAPCGWHHVWSFHHRREHDQQRVDIGRWPGPSERSLKHNKHRVRVLKPIPKYQSPRSSPCDVANGRPISIKNKLSKIRCNTDHNSNPSKSKTYFRTTVEKSRMLQSVRFVAGKLRNTRYTWHERLGDAESTSTRTSKLYVDRNPVQQQTFDWPRNWRQGRLALLLSCERHGLMTRGKFPSPFVRGWAKEMGKRCRNQ